tara:strand:- start:4296 stop:5426 length:1131 start_codon:yes stop_codon:yes gene_type:complete
LNTTNINNNLVDTIKILIYKEASILLEKLNFKDDNTFLEPLLFIYFNSKKDDLFPKQMLNEILQGYHLEKSEIKIKHSYNKENVAYLPRIGYFRKDEINPFDNIIILPNTNFEVITYQIINLKYIFRDFNNIVIDESKIIISKMLYEDNKKSLSRALSNIEQYSNNHYSLIEKCCKKIVLFKTDPKNTNSFATINAHGIAFLNVYQKEYDEVFFIDDIAHQTGHIIMTTLSFKRKEYFLIDENENIKSITNNPKEYRSLYILFHALYTYYTTTLCLDNCLSNNCFDENKTHEAEGRVGFYLIKYKLDLDSFMEVANHYNGLEMVLTKKAIFIFQMISDQFIQIRNKYYSTLKEFSYKNQPYNFTYKEFIKLNPIQK